LTLTLDQLLFIPFPFRGKKTERDKIEDRDLDKLQYDKPMPTSISELALLNEQPEVEQVPMVPADMAKAKKLSKK
jgi:hypothetical protein